jgi:hypothetical protein
MRARPGDRETRTNGRDRLCERFSAGSLGPGEGNMANGVFCLEGDWWGDLKRPTSVEPILELLEKSRLHVPYIYRDAGTREELGYYVRKWAQKKHADYPILYLGFHGGPGEIYVGDQRNKAGTIPLEWFEEELRGSFGPGDRRVILFGSCETLDVDGRVLRRILRATGLRALLGYKESVDFMDSTIFELVVLTGLQECSLLGQGITKLRKQIDKQHGRLSRELRFRAVTP